MNEFVDEKKMVTGLCRKQKKTFSNFDSVGCDCRSVWKEQRNEEAGVEMEIFQFLKENWFIAAFPSVWVAN